MYPVSMPTWSSRNERSRRQNQLFLFKCVLHSNARWFCGKKKHFMRILMSVALVKLRTSHTTGLVVVDDLQSNICFHSICRKQIDADASFMQIFPFQLVWTLFKISVASRLSSVQITPWVICQLSQFVKVRKIVENALKNLCSEKFRQIWQSDSWYESMRCASVAFCECTKSKLRRTNEHVCRLCMLRVSIKRDKNANNNYSKFIVQATVFIAVGQTVGELRALRVGIL